MTFDRRMNSCWWALKIGIGTAAFLAGADKFFDLLTNWSMYLSPFSERLLPMSASTFMHLVGIVEMAVGLAILTRWTRLGAYVAAAWLFLIAMNLVSSGGFFDLAIRDVEIAIGAYVLARMSEVREQPLAGNGAEPAVFADTTAQSARTA